MPEPEPAATTLDNETLAAWRAEAAEDTSTFIDPVVFRRAQAVLTTVGAGWLEYVVGRPVQSWTHLTNAELTLVLRAADSDTAHLQAVRDQEHAAYRAAERQRAERAKAEGQARREAWEALRAQLPVPVKVWHNWTARHCDGYEQGVSTAARMAFFSAQRGALALIGAAGAAWTATGTSHDLLGGALALAGIALGLTREEPPATAYSYLLEARRANEIYRACIRQTRCLVAAGR